MVKFTNSHLQCTPGLLGEGDDTGVALTRVSVREVPFHRGRQSRAGSGFSWGKASDQGNHSEDRNNPN